MTDRRSVFEFSGYKDLLRHLVRGRGKRGLLSRTADAIGCQRSYLSRVMNSEIQLTPDQAFLFARFWKFSPEERQYFQTLVEWDRASDRNYREELRQRIQELKHKHDSLAERIPRPQPSDTSPPLYFSAWHWSAIHFLTSSPNYRSAHSIAAKLNLPLELVMSCLKQLQEWSFVRKVGNLWEYAGGEFHLPSHSPFVVMHHRNWRDQAVLRSQMTLPEDVHYTNVQTIAASDYANLRHRLIDFISESSKAMTASSAEEAVVLTCDLFRI